MKLFCAVIPCYFVVSIVVADGLTIVVDASTTVVAAYQDLDHHRCLLE